MRAIHRVLALAFGLRLNEANPAISSCRTTRGFLRQSSTRSLTACGSPTSQLGPHRGITVEMVVFRSAKERHLAVRTTTFTASAFLSRLEKFANAKCLEGRPDSSWVAAPKKPLTLTSAKPAERGQE